MGPLAGIKVIEIAGIGPAPFTGMLLADLGAEVIRVERPGGGTFSGGTPALDFLNRGKRCICVNLKQPQGVDIVLRLIESADALIEGFRPGVMEKLGLGPEVCLSRNARLVYGRMTGWGQTGPLAQRAGHDLNYIALTGALHAIGPAGGKPAIPLNLVGDFGGGGMYLAFGLVSALLESHRSGRGQVVDAAMVDGASLLMASIYAATQAGFWREERGTNMLDGGAPFYDVYETADGRYVSLGAIEPQFYQRFIALSGLSEPLPAQYDAAGWPKLRELFTDLFLSKTQEEWCMLLGNEDVCFAPVLTPTEAPGHTHAQAREAYPRAGDYWQPAAGPRFSRTPNGVPASAAALGEHTDGILSESGFSAEDIAALRAQGSVA